MSAAEPIPTRTMVLGMVRRDGTLVADDLYRLANSVSMTGQQVRLCLRRLVAEGTLEQDGRGRKATFRTTSPDAAIRILPELEFADLARRQDAGGEPWDGRWHLAGFNIPESNRSARDRLRSFLMDLGTAPVHGGLYVTAHDLDGHLQPRLVEIGVEKNVTLLSTDDLTVAGISDPTRLAAYLWDLDLVASGWRTFSRSLAARMKQLSRSEPDRDALLAAVFQVVLEYTRAMQLDPLLPAELLPQPWAGARARDEMGAAWEQLRHVTQAFGELSLLVPFGDQRTPA